jgi:hypothetical protein
VNGATSLISEKYFINILKETIDGNHEVEYTKIFPESS